MSALVGKKFLMSSLRQEVLKTYKQILRAGKTWRWPSGQVDQTEAQRKYIISEAKELFRRNKYVSDESAIKQHLMEARARLEMALHYKNPYPRPVNLPPAAVASHQGKKWKYQEKIRTRSKPIYIKSIDPES
ncbi:LYR motif-containing protein 1-like [Centruroides sculpturatus]|uniref:LYR motif-containing protein 1-like n=1 Tax=Centruroides sculpturatus TaxID=218467 RepID=UPI000C6CBDE4|nr:LYR motif-containing protein 1-like [Centruroides sculpturatus]